MRLVQDGKCINDERGNHVAKLATPQRAEFIVRAVSQHCTLVAERDILKSTHEMMDQHVKVLLAQKRQLVEALTLCQTWVADDPFMKEQVAAALAAARIPC